MADPKITAALNEALSSEAEHEWVEVVVELAPTPPPLGPSRDDRLAALRSGFESEAAPVEEAIRRAGGDVVARVWLNQTLRARLPRAGLQAVCDLRQVRRIDRAERLLPE